MQPLDPKYFRAFKAVDQAGSFSDAADLAAMTQANVSKHIRALEDQVGSELFVRAPKGPVITETGIQLRAYIRRLENLQADFMVDIGNIASEVKGTVRYAMPASCLLSPHFPMLLERRKQYPALEIELGLMPTEQVFDQILEGNIDFGFVTRRIEHPRLEYLPFCQEQYVAVTAPELSLADLSPQTLLTHRYISYPGFDTYFEYWRNHYFPDASHTHALSLHYAGRISTIEGAILMTLGGLGVGIFPRHCIQQHLDSGALVEYAPQGSAPLMNDIYIAMLKMQQRPYRVDLTVSWFMDMVSE